MARCRDSFGYNVGVSDTYALRGTFDFWIMNTGELHAVYTIVGGILL